MDVTVKKWFTFDIKFLIFSTWSRCGIYVMKKYRVSTTNVPIFIEIRSGDKIRSIIFERSYGLQTVKLPRWGRSDYRRIPQDTTGYRMIPQDPFLWTVLMNFSMLLHSIVIFQLIKQNILICFVCRNGPTLKK